MSNLRFATAQGVFDAYPRAAGDIEGRPQDDTEAPLDFLDRLLASPTPEDAASFSSYLLGRRDAVAWACKAHRLFAPPVDQDDEMGLLVAETWVREPEEHNRRAALALGLGGNHAVAGTWLSLAAGGAGGTFIIEGQPGPPVPGDMTAKAVRSAVLIALARLPIHQRAEQLAAATTMCRRLALGEEKAS